MTLKANYSTKLLLFFCILCRQTKENVTTVEIWCALDTEQSDTEAKAFKSLKDQHQKNPSTTAAKVARFEMEICSNNSEEMSSKLA